MREALPRKPKSITKQSQQLSWWAQQIGDLALADLRPALIAEYRDKLANETTAKLPFHVRAVSACGTIPRYRAAVSRKRSRCRTFTISYLDSHSREEVEDTRYDTNVSG